MTENPIKPHLDQIVQPKERAIVHPGYSKFIRALKTVLPLIAAAILISIFAWNDKTDIAPKNTETTTQPTITKNELLNPKFESMDEKKQPFTITSKKATQSKQNENIIILDHPFGDIQLTTGNWIAAQSDQGLLNQSTSQLWVKNNVELYHDSGYTLKTEELQINLENQTAINNKPIHIQGPIGSIDAQKMQGNMRQGLLTFFGPAQLTLYDTNAQNNLKDLAQ